MYSSSRITHRRGGQCVRANRCLSLPDATRKPPMSVMPAFGEFGAYGLVIVRIIPMACITELNGLIGRWDARIWSDM